MSAITPPTMSAASASEPKHRLKPLHNCRHEEGDSHREHRRDQHRASPPGLGRSAAGLAPPRQSGSPSSAAHARTPTSHQDREPDSTSPV